MKKIVLAYSITALLIMIMINGSHAQSANAGMASTSEYFSFSDDANAANGFTPVFLNDINTKAMRNFARDYKNTSLATWFKLKDGFVVYFTDKGINVRVAYDRKGNYLWTIRDYTEDKLPFEIRDLVKTKYYDLNIFHIAEVRSDGGIAYTIKLEGKTTWRIIKVVDGEMTVLNDYVKN